MTLLSVLALSLSLILLPLSLSRRRANIGGRFFKPNNIKIDASDVLQRFSFPRRYIGIIRILEKVREMSFISNVKI